MRRFHRPDGRFVADAIYEIDHRVGKPCVIVDLQTEQQTEVLANIEYTDLLVPIFRNGENVYQVPKLTASRECTREQLRCAPREILRLDDPTPYKIGLERSLHELRSTLISRAKEL